MNPNDYGETAYQVMKNYEKYEGDLQQINEAVARKLGTWEKYECDGTPHLGHIILCQPPPPYSTSIEAAWEILISGARPRVTGVMRHGTGWLAIDYNGRTVDADLWAETAPLAICKAFLALEDEKAK